MALLEIACFDPDSAIIASQAGADRIELCDDQAAGGVSPPLEWLQRVKVRVTIPVFVMLRPRGGDFNYSPDEFATMQTALGHFKQHGADGFVLGILDAHHAVDTARTAQLVQLAHPLPCTFHRAFDDTLDPALALDHVADTGCRAVLSSGGAPTAWHGADMLRTLVVKAASRVDIIPGGGVRSANLAHIRAVTRAPIFHSSAVVPGSSRPDAAEIRRMKLQLEEAPSQLDHALSLPTSLSASASDRHAADDDSSMFAVSTGARTPVSQ